MGLYVIEKRCSAVVDGKVLQFRPGPQLVSIDDSVATRLGDAVRRYGIEAAPQPAEQVPDPQPDTEGDPEPGTEDAPKPRARSGRGSDG